MMNKSILALFLLFLIGGKAIAQELNATVVVQTPQLRLADPKMFKTLETDLTEFMNSRKWTEDVYKIDERIDCSFLISVLSEESATSFTASITVQADRPVLNSSYKSVILNHQDKDVKFQYAEYEPLEYNDNSYESELTSLMAYYAYVIIGLDNDSFSPNAGDVAFSRAQNVVQNARQSKSKGWQAFDGTRNRYWLIDNLLNKRFKELRQSFYTYHRQGLDKMYDDPAKARQGVNQALGLMKKVQKDMPNAMATVVFLNAKRDEVIGIFKHSQIPPSERNTAYNTMVTLDPANLQKYSDMKGQAGVGGKSLKELGLGKGAPMQTPRSTPTKR